MLASLEGGGTVKTNKRLDEEIKAVAHLWNSSEYSYGSPQSLILGAVYDTLCWARGCRETPPLEMAKKRVERIGGATNG